MNPNLAFLASWRENWAEIILAVWVEPASLAVAALRVAQAVAAVRLTPVEHPRP
jgi:hypothetical protein